MAKVLAIVEQRDGTLKKVSEEVVTAARMIADGIGGEVDAVVVGGSGIGEAAKGLGRFGADRVIAVEAEALKAYNPQGYAEALAERAKAEDYFAVLFPATSAGRDLAPRVAAKLDVPMASEVTDLKVEGGQEARRGGCQPRRTGRAALHLAEDGQEPSGLDLPKTGRQ